MWRFAILNFKSTSVFEDWNNEIFYFTKQIKSSQKSWPKILTPYFFYSYLYLHFLRLCSENIFKNVCIISEKIGKYSHNLTYCSSFQPVFVYNFSEIESTFSVPIWDYVADWWWLRGMVSICLIGKGKYDWFLHKERLLDWLIFILYLVQFVCCSKYSAKATMFHILNLFLHFLHFRIFATVMRSEFRCLLKFSTRGT